MINRDHKSPIRILFVCHDAKIYGAQKSLKLMVENLPQDQYEIFVTFPMNGPLVDVFREIPGVQVLFHKRIRTVKHNKRNLLQRLGDIAGVLLGLCRVPALAKTIHDKKIDLVHTNTLVTFQGALAAKLTGTPHVWHIRETFEDYNPRFHLILGKTLTKFLVHHLSTCVLSVSKYVGNQFKPYLDKHPEHYHVLHNAIEPTEGNTPVVRMDRPDDGKLRVLYLGRLSDGKRFHDLLEASVLLKQHYGNSVPIEVRAYGEFICPHFEQFVRNTIDQHQLSDFFHLMPYENNIAPCFDWADILAMPSSTEAFGRTLLEAMSRGMPVVTARAGAPPEIVEEGVTGYFHAPNHPQSLAETLEMIHARRHTLKQMQSACLQTIEDRFNIHHYIQHLDALYRTILRSSPGEQTTLHNPCWHGS